MLFENVLLYANENIKTSYLSLQHIKVMKMRSSDINVIYISLIKVFIISDAIYSGRNGLCVLWLRTVRNLPIAQRLHNLILLMRCAG